MLGFLRNFAGVKADNAVQAGVEALVRWDPEGASEAELSTMEQLRLPTMSPGYSGILSLAVPT